MKKLSNKQYQSRYNSYVRQTRAWEAKGYSVTVLGEGDFRREYDRARRKAIAIGDPKKSIIREMASDSREVTAKELRAFRKGVREYNKAVQEWNDFVDDYNATRRDLDEHPERALKYESFVKEEKDISKMSRNDVWEYALYEMYGEDYSAAGAFYNGLFN